MSMETTNENYGTFETPFGTATVTYCRLDYVLAKLPPGLVVNRVAHSSANVAAHNRGGEWSTGANLRRERPNADYSYYATDKAEDKVDDEVGPRLLAWIEKNDATLWSGEADLRTHFVRTAMRDVQSAQQALAEQEAKLVEAQAKLAQAEWMRETLKDLDEASPVTTR